MLYYDELSEAELAYLTGQRAAITARITELTGLTAEVRAEGIAMVDPIDDLTDVRMPESGTEGHVTLLLAEYLADPAQREVELAKLHEKVRQLATENRTYWRRNSAEPGAEIELTTIALNRLEALRLITVADGRVVARPALSRYALAEPTIQESR